MSHLLWKSYWENDVDKFRRLLAPAGPNSYAVSKSPAIGGSGAYLAASPGGFATSPRISNKSRKTSGPASGHGKSKDGNSNIGKAEINSRDHAGLTVLLRAASSPEPNGKQFVQALIEHPAIDLYVQDPESGWNALHRSLYSGNISVARMLLAKERADLASHTLVSISKVGLLIKTKDHEGNSPFDVYNSTIATRSLKQAQDSRDSDSDSDSGDSAGEYDHGASNSSHTFRFSAEGDELFVFGSNKNLSLGVGDENDRQYPERMLLQRPDQLMHRFYESYLSHHDLESPVSLPKLEDIPTLVRSLPVVIQDVAMSKFHTAVLTADPVSNLYVSGLGRGGRLGLGDENTQFKFVPVQGPFSDKKVRQVALGQNHSMAVVGNGELWTWGLNSDSQLGYILPAPMRADEHPMSLSPRQVFGSLKKEIVVGVACSAAHSVAHTGSSLYCWGRNLGQLALMDADSRSLDVQQTPRKVAASLLSAPIEMVSAIDKATTCLLSNSSVWVFTNYGYNVIKFPFPDVFKNHSLSAGSFANRFDSGRRDVRYVTSGGDTIAAVTARGDLFTMQLNHEVEVSQPAGSTTNPVKIKGAVRRPLCIWDSRKDGVASVSVGEHGSVIICTESGAVWRRVKRVKSKIAAFAASADTKRSDFKFERVPYITNCVSVRSSTFGAFAAIRKDSHVMSEDITVAEESLWSDVGSLLCLNTFTPSDPSPAAKVLRKKWDAAISRENPDSIPHKVLQSPNIEEDLSRWLQMNSLQYDDIDAEIRTSTAPDTRIPIHGWLLSGRSSILRCALSEFRLDGSPPNSEVFEIENINGKQVVTLLGVDVFTVLNIVAYVYQDTIIPVWKYTREAPALAYRFRQVRTELMKVATKLKMPKLEAAARLQSGLEPSLDADLHEAISDAVFFEDADVIVELDGAETTMHSKIICQRCPFFEGMFHGRSQGQWLTSRRNESHVAEQVRIDLKHMRPEIFQYVVAFIYADAGQEMFNDVATATIDDFSELVLDVMGAANELMLDRLSEICQFVLGKFVTVRNVANLLNEISPCSVTVFKDAGLEYICLQLEALLENHLLDGLDEDVLQELDSVVQDNQLACLPFARSGRAELLLHEKYPDLALDIEEERQRRVKRLASKAAQKDDERKLSSSYKARFGSLDESSVASPTPDRSRRRSKPGRNEPFSPSLRPRASQGDLIFDMDEENTSVLGSRPSPNLTSPDGDGDVDVDAETMPQLPEAWRESRGKEAAGSMGLSPASPSFSQNMSAGLKPSKNGASRPTGSPLAGGNVPWASPALGTTKLDMKGIMSETSSKSALTASLAAQATKDTAASRPQTKVSQKERKRQMQMQAEAQAKLLDEQTQQGPWEPASTGKRTAPWKAATPIPKTSLKEAMASEASPQGAASASAKPLIAAEANSQHVQRRAASPDTRFSGQGRTNSSPAVPKASEEHPQRNPIVPHSKSYVNSLPKTEEAFPGASMADIIGQQRREQELVKEAVAKRSLQEIQEEQAFQEWWDQESQRAQDEEARRQARNRGKDEAGRRGRRGKGTGSKGSKTGGTAEATAQKSGGPGAPRGRGGKGRGKAAKE